MPGRNDPCPCGSGKKYKKCCGAKDKAEQQANHAVVNKPPVTKSVQDEWVETDLPPLFNPPKPEPEPDPLIEQFNTFWDAFEGASYEERWQLLDDLLVNQPELLDGELIFETGNRLFRQAVEKDDVERFSRFLDQIETVAPEAYQAELAYILDWRIQIALLEKDRAAVQHYFDQFSLLAGDKLDQYHRIISALLYHGELEILLTGMRQARPYVAKGGGLVPWAYEEFVDKLASLEILFLAKNNPEATAEDPELKARFGEYELTINSEGMNLRLDYLTGRKLPPWTLADFERLAGKGKKDPNNSHFTYLLDAFLHYAHYEERVPFTRAGMAQQELAEYLIGQDKDQPGKNRLSRSRKQPGQTQEQPYSLYPTAETLDSYLGELMGFMSFRFYEASALFELLPAWLRFLAKYNLLDQKVHEKLLQSLNYLKDPLIQIARQQLTDPLVETNLAGWPYRGEKPDGMV